MHQFLETKLILRRRHVKQIIQIRPGTHRPICIRRNFQLALCLAFLRGNHDYPVRRTRPVNGSRCRILQHRHRLHVVRVNRRKRITFKHITADGKPVHHDQRIVIRLKISITHTDLRYSTLSPDSESYLSVHRCAHHRQSRYQPDQRLREIGRRFPPQCLRIHDRVSTRGTLLGNRLVTGNHHVVQVLAILLHRHPDKFLFLHRYLLLLHAHERENKHMRPFFRQTNLETTRRIRHDSRSRSLQHDSRSRQRDSLLVNYHTFDNPLLHFFLLLNSLLPNHDCLLLDRKLQPRAFQASCQNLLHRGIFKHDIPIFNTPQIGITVHETKLRPQFNLVDNLFHRGTLQLHAHSHLLRIGSGMHLQHQQNR